MVGPNTCLWTFWTLSVTLWPSNRGNWEDLYSKTLRDSVVFKVQMIWGSHDLLPRCSFFVYIKGSILRRKNYLTVANHSSILGLQTVGNSNMCRARMVEKQDWKERNTSYNLCFVMLHNTSAHFYSPPFTSSQFLFLLLLLCLSLFCSLRFLPVTWRTPWRTPCVSAARGPSLPQRK